MKRGIVTLAFVFVFTFVRVFNFFLCLQVTLLCPFTHKAEAKGSQVQNQPYSETPSQKK
jgi:hypothetical protein